MKLGCQVVVSGDSATECENAALDVAKEYAGFLVHPFRSPSQIRGYTTLWREIAERFPETERMLWCPWARVGSLQPG